jgi:hypothetical protein
MSETMPEDPSKPPAKPDAITQQVHYSQISARVPDRISRGVFATHALVLAGSQELVCDFLLRMVPPFLLAARVVLPYSALGPVVKAISENLENRNARFGAPMALPTPPPTAPQPNIAEVYEQLKIPEDVAVGAYANTLMISHSASEFCMDFILDLYPKPTVTQRIYMSAAQIPPFLSTLKRTLEQVQQRAMRPNPPVQPPPPPPTPPENT